MADELRELRDELRVFATDRDWDQFHSPKNLATALAVEVGELLEHFQWLSDDQSRNLGLEQRAKVESELADVFIYGIRLADKLGVDLVEAARKKVVINAERYPIAKARGNAKKYTDL